ncbi:hypothetical protein TcasGA2_TC006136 [Tribolium castaneum]|uniref:Integrase catalytic domain-containing protein n=1 Tax=Tribolium castaneum TaxID=7070 RepID=D6WUK0_TRICA|nr:hypothetical protein TcasGA2_TC006136 [Tribolium castaneum]
MAPTKENELKSLQGKRQSLFLRIQRLYNDSRNLDDETVCKNFKIRYNTLEETRRLFSNCIDSINLLSLELDSDYTPSFAELEAVDELYCHIVEAAKKVFTKTENLLKPVKAIAKLPKIELMEFSGEMSDWPIFYDTFRTLIHENPDLDDITRMHYLLGKLTGKALLVCSGIQPTGANYPILWKALVEKYDDKRLLANAYLSQILDFRPLQNESVVCLNTFLEKFDTAVNALKQLDIENLSDFIISSIALSKLDGQTRRHFELSQKKSEIPLYKEIVDFVKDHTKILACTLKSTATTANRTNYSAPFSKPSRTHSLVVSNRASNNICPICNEASHLVYQCAKLLKLGPLERYQLVKDKALCLNCLSPKHKIIACKSTTTCSLCRKRHHSLLHFDKPHIETSEQPAKKDLVPISDVNSTSREPHSFCVASNTSFKSSRYSNTLLATAIVEIFAPNSKKKLVRLLVDPASQSHFITTNCCTRLNLPIRKINASVKGIGAITHPIKGKIDTVIASRFNSDYRYKFEALVIDQIIDNLPDRNIPQSSIENLLNLPLADEKFFESGEIDGIISARLIHFVESTFQSRLIIENIVALTDSSVVLNWINASPHRWHTFVANRVAKIQELVPSVNWYHVDGKENPADPISRGLTPAHLLNHPIWLTGPSWLFMDEQLWPINSSTNTDEPPLEEKPIVLVTFSRCVNPLRQLIDRSSSYSKLRNAVVYVLRFLKILPKGNLITLKDLETAELTLVRLVQREHFASDLALLEQNKPCSPKIRALCPFLKDGVIRVGGRLSNSNLEYDQQHPFLLPKKDHLVDLLIDYFHQRNLHTGPHLTLSLLRQKFWILAARNVVRHRIRNCNYCFKFRPRATFPCMADLPAPRITEAKPFLHSGVDYAGPFYITLTRRRGVKSQKAYLCLFICLVTKALHLEVASDLSTATFINAFKRFLSRRGPCSVLYSDCGTNFIGAKTALDDLSKFVTSQEYHSSIDDELIKRNVVWKFNPPAAPHFGGIWEANIKSVKSHLTKVIGTQILTYEEFTTVITQIEALLNSRPLCTLSSDPNEPLALTPAHFLTGTPLQSLPIQNLDMSTNLVTRKELLDQILQTYWKRWHMEYLHNLQVRQKWNKPSSPIKVGTVVVLRTDNTPPLHWPLGVVQEVFPGKDGIVRVASVKTPNGLYKRPIVRLCPFQISDRFDPIILFLVICSLGGCNYLQFNLI